MNCKNHPYNEARFTCSKCGAKVCHECIVEVGGKLVCKDCLSKAMGDDRSNGSRDGYEDVRRGTEKKPSYSSKRYINGLLLLLLSLPPGINFMYMGLMKRGLFYMCAFFGTIYLIANLHAGLLGLAIPVIIFSSIFDAQHKKRRINSGELVKDEIDDIILFVRRFKVPIIIILALSVLGSIARMVFATMAGGFMLIPGLNFGGHGHASFVPFVVVCILAWVFLRKRGKHSRRNDDRENKN